MSPAAKIEALEDLKIKLLESNLKSNDVITTTINDWKNNNQKTYKWDYTNKKNNVSISDIISQNRNIFHYQKNNENRELTSTGKLIDELINPPQVQDAKL